MALWGTAHAAATNKPKFLTEDENSDYTKGICYATQRGWVVQAGSVASGCGNTAADPEVLVCIGGLGGASSVLGLRTPTVTDMRFIIGTTANTDLSANDANAEIQVEITWDEEVTIAGSPQLTLANSNASGGGYTAPVLTYTSVGSTANRKRFRKTSCGIGNTDVLTIGGANIALNSGTISDTVVGGTTLAASLVLSGLTAVTHTVTF